MHTQRNIIRNDTKLPRKTKSVTFASDQARQGFAKFADHQSQREFQPLKQIMKTNQAQILALIQAANNSGKRSSKFIEGKQRQAAVQRAKVKRDRFKGTANSSFLPPSSDTPCKLSGIKYNGNPLSCMA